MDSRLLAAVKAYVARTARTLTGRLGSLRATLALKEGPRPRKNDRLPVYGKGGLRPGVDLDKTGELLNIMDGMGLQKPSEN